MRSLLRVSQIIPFGPIVGIDGVTPFTGTLTAADVTIQTDTFSGAGNTFVLGTITSTGNGYYQVPIPVVAAAVTYMDFRVKLSTTISYWESWEFVSNQYMAFKTGEIVPSVNVTQLDSVALTSGHASGKMPVDLTLPSVYPANVTQIDGVATTGNHLAGYFPADLKKIEGVTPATHTSGKIAADVVLPTIYPSNVTQVNGTNVVSAVAGKFPTDINNDAAFSSAILAMNNNVNSNASSILTDTSTLKNGVSALQSSTDTYGTKTTAVYNKLPTTGLIASQPDVQSIQNNTSFVCTVPDTAVTPAVGNRPYILHVYLYDEAGNMEDPDSNIVGISMAMADSTDMTGKLFTTKDFTAALSDATGMTGYKALVRVDVGHYMAVYRFSSTDAIGQLLTQFKYVEGGAARYVGRSCTVLAEQPGTAVLAATSTNKEVIASAIRSYVPSAALVSGSIESDLSGNITSVHTHIDSVTNSILSDTGIIRGDTATLKNEVADNTTSLQNLNTATYNMRNAVDSIGTMVVDVHGDIGHLAADIGIIDTNVGTLTGVTQQIVQDVNAVNLSVQSVLAETAEIISGISTIEGYTDSLESSMTTLLSDATTIKSDLDAVESSLADISTKADDSTAQAAIIAEVHGIPTDIMDLVIDGVPVSKILVALQALAVGGATITDLAGGRREISYKKHDGSTEAFAVETSNSGIARLRW